VIHQSSRHNNCPQAAFLHLLAHILLIITPATFEGCTIQEWALELNIPFLGKRKWCNLNPLHHFIRPTLWRWRSWAVDYLNS
jgi:hypothetical protein